MEQKANLTNLKDWLFLYNINYVNTCAKINELNSKKFHFKAIKELFKHDVHYLIERAYLIFKHMSAIYGNDYLSIKLIDGLTILQELTQKEARKTALFEKTKSECLKIAQILNDDFDSLITQLSICEEEAKSLKKTKDYANRCILLLKINQIINDDDLKFLYNFIDQQAISTKSKIELYSQLLFHNKKCDAKHENQEIDVKSIFNMLSFGFVMVETSSLPYNAQILSKVELEKNNFKYLLTEEDISKYLKVLQKVYNEDDLQIIVMHLINYYNDEISTLIELIKEKDFFADAEIKDEVIKEFNFMALLVSKLHDLYQTIYTTTNVDINYDKQLIYATKESGKPYIISDLKDFNYEYLNKMQDLIERFKLGQLINHEFEGFSGSDNLIPFKKIKSDQIRILIKHMKNNIWCVVGVAIKKTDRGNEIYLPMASRGLPKNIEEALEKSKEIELEIEEYIINNARRGSK